MNESEWKLGDPIPTDVVVVDDESDLDKVPIRLPSGHVLNESEAVRYGAEVAARADAVRRGRRSLSAAGTHSPILQTRLPEDVYAQVRRLAEARAVPISVVTREATLEYLEAHPA